MNNCKHSIEQHSTTREKIQGDFFDWAHPKSEDGKIPTKKVKVIVKTLHLAVGLLHFHFLSWDFAILNFLGQNQ